MFPERGIAVAVLLLCSMLSGCWTQSRTEDPYVVAFRNIKPSIALITVDDDVHADTQAYGSASVVKSDGHGTWLLTDAHVVMHARTIHVQIGVRSLGTGRMVAADASHDVALIKVRAYNLRTIQLGDSALLEPGMQIGIAGYPIPDAFEDAHLAVTPSLYAGRVASVRTTALEVDAPIIPGDSGGPVFDPTTGLVIGISEARFDDERAIGLVTPVNLIKRFLQRELF